MFVEVRNSPISWLLMAIIHLTYFIFPVVKSPWTKI